MFETSVEPRPVIDGLDAEELSRSDAMEAAAPAFETRDEAGESHRLEVRERHHPHDHAHVDLMKDEYIPEEVALMLGTSQEVIMHAIWKGELRAKRRGRHVISIPRAALIDWYRRGG
jgi:hypothetical protein